MNKKDVVKSIVVINKTPTRQSGEAFAPSNIALCKYWGKRDENINLPFTNSLSISLGNQGTFTKIEINDKKQDEVYLNGKIVAKNSKFYLDLIDFLSLFRKEDTYFRVITNANIPIGAGVASSASGYAAATLALNELYDWKLPKYILSIIARLGSGSASRSLWHGFVEWEAGDEKAGLDSFAKPLGYVWPELRVGLLLFSTEQKAISSRVAMAATVKTCPFYQLWPSRVATAITKLKEAINNHDFVTFGEVLERNALEMHALMLSTYPSIVYSNAATIAAMETIRKARALGINVYFTQDAGPNIKLLFLQKDEKRIKELFSEVKIINPWDTQVSESIKNCNINEESVDFVS